MQTFLPNPVGILVPENPGDPPIDILTLLKAAPRIYDDYTTAGIGGTDKGIVGIKSAGQYGMLVTQIDVVNKAAATDSTFQAKLCLPSLSGVLTGYTVNASGQARRRNALAPSGDGSGSFGSSSTWKGIVPSGLNVFPYTYTVGVVDAKAGLVGTIEKPIFVPQDWSLAILNNTQAIDHAMRVYGIEFQNQQQQDVFRALMA